MSDQVYGNSLPPPVNRIISELVTAPGGDIVVNSLTLTASPAVSVHNERALVRNSSAPDPIGMVENGGAVIVDTLILDANPALNVDAVPPRCLVRDATTHAVEDASNISVNRILLVLAPTLNNGLATMLAWNPVTGFVEQRLATTLPDNGFTYRYVDVAQLTGDGTPEAVRFPVSGADDLTGVSYNNGTAAFTVLRSGIFTISWTVAWAAAAVGTRETWLTVDNISGVLRYGSVVTRPDTTDPSTISSSVTFRMANSSVFRIHMMQTGTVGLDIIGTAAGSEYVTQIDISRLTIS